MGWNVFVVTIVAIAMTAGAAVADGVAGSSSPAVPPLSIRLGPQVSFEPAAVRITSFVEPDAKNRALVIEVESGRHFSSSTVPLDGDQAPRSHAMLLKNLPAGDYEVIVRLRDEQGQTRMISRSFQVLSSRAQDR